MTDTQTGRPVIGVAQRPLRRGRENAILGGVCGGFATRLGVRERNIRIAFSVVALFFGLGVLVYITLWLVLTRAGEDKSIIQRIFENRRDAQVVLVAFLATLVLLVALQSFSAHNAINLARPQQLFGFHHGATNYFFSNGYTWPFLLSLFGAFAIWRGASIDERARLQDLLNSAPLIGAVSTKSRKAIWLRVIAGVVLVVVGLNILSQIGGIWGAAVPALIGTFILLGGVLVMLAPWWLQTMRELTSERRARVRIEERANMVAHIHDSVLQTLTLIERAAGNESDVVRLARNQERELRQWLFNPDALGARTDASATFASLVGGIERDIENDYGVKVELVVVGDCPSNDGIEALAAAGREAAVNAAKWSGATTISIFAEVSTTSVALYVRDTGAGFDLASVPSDRQGIALSIRQRMFQHGGEATIRTTPGSGTEVELTVARTR